MYKVLIPNLLKREDRFLFCVGILVGQGHNPLHIEQHIALDGSHFRNSADIAYMAKEQFNNTHPIHGSGTYITECYEGWDQWNYSYCYTYYMVWNRIASEPDCANPTITIQDDWQSFLTRDEISKEVTSLCLAENDFHMLQYVGSTCDPKDATPLSHRKTSVPNIQHGIKGSGDQFIVFSPKGARKLVEFADANPQHAPEVLMYYFSRCADNTGCYSAINNKGICYPHRFYSQFQDRCTQTGGVTTEYIGD